MLNTKLTKILLHTTDNYIKALEKGGFSTVQDLLYHFPREYEDRTNVLDNFSLVNIKDKNTILVTLVSINTQMTGGGKLVSKAVLEDKNGFLSEAVWFNRKYLATTLQVYQGKKVIVSGKVKYAFGKVTFQSPEVETDLSKVSGEIVPVYSDINYIPSKWTAGKIELLKKYISEIVEDIPENIIKKYNFIPKKEAVYKIHFPKNKNDIEQAKYRLAYGELYEINYKSLSVKHENFKNSEGKSLALKMNVDLIKDIISNLPFDLTDHQKIVLFQILKDMEKTHSMQRLLEGDVGTGKTAVALIAAIHAIIESDKNPTILTQNSPHPNQQEQPHPSQQEQPHPSPLLQERGEKVGIIEKFLNSPSPVGEGARGGGSSRIQAAIMAPTEILARQHFEGMQELFMKYNISSHLLVGSLSKKQKDSVKADIGHGNIDIVIGTHALVQEDVLFHRLGFVVVDEQHRFGVKQREVLEKYVSGHNSETALSPHVLNMTATPIPRTLALTLYGDQDLSIISQYPKGRKDIYTKVAKNDNQRNEIELFVRSQLEQGRQVFWISPLVEESEKIDLANAIHTYENLIEIFHPFRVGLLHGKMKPKEKDEVMRDFSENKIQVLSSTSVVEVGVNIPNATIMCIEGAERFGLSQLHQFRGRVGRGAYQSYCYLFPTNGNQTDRLKAMESTNNGFELAEIDLELRGPGEVYGVRQSGVPDLKVADLRDLELISQIREDIEELFEKSEK
ncbi:MAG: ATP-dependent DNA helicase RecG [Candidatus Gracilibacteria bacterium]|nr:ATP-dependent DNA helicase RecG [Candidatus Gracilibacteria bacterium]